MFLDVLFFKRTGIYESLKMLLIKEDYSA